MVCGGPDQWSLLTHTRSDGCGPIGRVKLTCFGVNLRMTIGLVSAIFGPNFNEINDLQVLLPGQLVPSPLCVIQRRLNECSPKPRVVGSIPASRATFPSPCSQGLFCSHRPFVKPRLRTGSP